MHDPDSDADLILHGRGADPGMGCPPQIHQDDPRASAVDSHALAAMLDDHAHRHGSDACSAGLLEALLTHPALRAEGPCAAAGAERHPARPPPPCVCAGHGPLGRNTPPSRFELDDPAYQRAYRLSAPLEVRALLAEAVRQQALVRLYPDGGDAALNACWRALDETISGCGIIPKPGSLLVGATGGGGQHGQQNQGAVCPVGPDSSPW